MRILCTALWSCSGQAHSPWAECWGSCFHSLCSRFGTRKKENQAAEHETKELQSKECLPPKEGEFCFTHVPCRHWQPMPWWLLICFQLQEVIPGVQNKARLCKEEPISIFQSPHFREGPERAGSLRVFSASFLPYPPHTSALFTLKSIFHCRDPYTLVLPSHGVLGHQGWHVCLHFFMTLASDLFPSVPFPSLPPFPHLCLL